MVGDRMMKDRMVEDRAEGDGAEGDWAEGDGAGRSRPVIVVFGAAVLRDGRPSRTLERRVAAALRFGAGLPGVLYVPTGAAGRHGASEASVMAGLLRAGGAREVVLEESGVDTLSSVLACAALLRARGEHGAVYAASSAYHLPRCLLLLRLAGVGARACPPPRVPAAGQASRRWFWRLREVPAVPWDVAALLWKRARQARLGSAQTRRQRPEAFGGG